MATVGKGPGRAHPPSGEVAGGTGPVPAGYIRGMSPWLRRVAWVCSSVLAAAGMVAAPAQAGTSPAAPACGAGRLVSSPSPATFDSLYGIAAVSPQDVWAVGRYIENNSGNVSRALVEHWAGRRWHAVRVPQPSAHNAYLFAVAAVSASDIWAVGYADNARYSGERTLTEHWNGSAWRIVPSPSGGVLDAVTASAAGGVWAAGTSAQGHSLAERWTGTRWSVATTPSPGRFGDDLAGVTAAGPDDVWAAGTTGTSKFGATAVLTEHWDGTRWAVVTAPRLGIGSEFRAVASAGSNDVWAVGDYQVQTPTGTAYLTLTEHWDGARWTIVSSPSPTGDDDFGGVAAVSASDIWAAGSAASDNLVAHWNGHAWSLVASPHRSHTLDLLAAVSASDATNVWAAGGDIDLHGYSYHTLVENVCPR